MITKSKVPFFGVMLFAMMATTNCAPKKNSNATRALTSQPAYERVGHHYDISITFTNINSSGAIKNVSVAAKDCTTVPLKVAEKFQDSELINGECVIQRDGGICQIQAIYHSKKGPLHPTKSIIKPRGEGHRPTLECIIKKTNNSSDKFPKNVEAPVRTQLQFREGDSFEYEGVLKINQLLPRHPGYGVVNYYSLQNLNRSVGKCLSGEKGLAYTSTPPCDFPQGTHIEFYNPVNSTIRPRYGLGRNWLSFPEISQEHDIIKKVILLDKRIGAKPRLLKATVKIKEDVLCTQGTRGPIERCRIWEQELTCVDC